MVALDRLPVLVALADFVIVIATSALLTYVLKAFDSDSIISLRRTFGLLLVPNSVWALLGVVGSLVSTATGNLRPSLNEFILGAFFAWSFELIIINGAFMSNTLQSLCIAALQPMAVLLLTSAFIIHANSNALYAVASGFLTLAIATIFLLKFKTFKTEGVGINSLQTFQSFLKSWVSQKPASLEGYFTLYSHDELVTTKIVLAGATDKAALVLPGVHPGPFFPVGSYNLSELIYQELRKKNIVPMVLHGTGGHERNLPTNDATKRYASAIADVVVSKGAGQEVHNMRGPVRSTLGVTSITMLGFGNQIVAFLSNAPYNTDDLEPTIIDEALSAAKELGMDLMLVDAHNSIGGENTEQSHMTKDDWRRAMSTLKGSAEHEFETGVAHSSEIQFEHGTDISDGGICVLVFRNQASSSAYALVTSDSNNAALGLRQAVMDGLKNENVELIELCTSDTHNSAARHLTDRGYRALGEDTSRDAIVAAIKKLEKIADDRSSGGTATPITSELTLPLIGEKSLHDFAVLTKETLDFTKVYAQAALVSALILCALALLY